MTTSEALAKLKPAFKKDGGFVTAGNSSSINDGVAFQVADASAAEVSGHQSMACLVS